MLSGSLVERDSPIPLDITDDVGRVDAHPCLIREALPLVPGFVLVGLLGGPGCSWVGRRSRCEDGGEESGGHGGGGIGERFRGGPENACQREVSRYLSKRGSYLKVWGWLLSGEMVVGARSTPRWMKLRLKDGA